MPETRTEYWNRIQGLRSGNAHIKDAVAYFDEHYEETDEVIRRFIEGSKLTNEEFITFIAIRRLEGLRRSSGNASSAMMDQIRREYKNTPWKFVEEFLQNADDCSYDGTPEIQIIVDERKSAIEFIYNERGFTRNDIWALTQFSDSTKPSSKDLTVRAQENGLFFRLTHKMSSFTFAVMALALSWTMTFRQLFLYGKIPELMTKKRIFESNL